VVLKTAAGRLSSKMGERNGLQIQMGDSRREAPDGARGELQVSVARTEHGGEPRGLFLPAPTFAWFLKMPMVPHLFQGAFAVDFFLQSPQRPIHGFALF